MHYIIIEMQMARSHETAECFSILVSTLEVLQRYLLCWEAFEPVGVQVYFLGKIFFSKNLTITKLTGKLLSILFISDVMS